MAPDEKKYLTEVGKVDRRTAVERFEESKQKEHYGRERLSEKRETLTPEEEAIKEQLKKEIDLIDVDDSLKKEAEAKANKIGALDEERKLKKLLAIAKSKGVIFAIKVANEMKDPYILDIFHDLLVKEGLYKKFAK